MNDIDFLIGTVPGCDLRVPGADLPPLLCVLARHPEGVQLRKLAHTQVVLVNGQTASSSPLRDGDRLTVGAVDVIMHVQIKAQGTGSPRTDASLTDRTTQLEKRERELRELAHKLDQERKQLAAQRQTMAQAVADDKPTGQTGGANTLEARAADVERQKQELAGVRQELADIRKQLYERYQERRDRLAGLQEAVNRAARKVQDQKRALEAEAQQLAQARKQDAARHGELETRAVEFANLMQRFEEERRLFEQRQLRQQKDLTDRLAELATREEKLLADCHEFTGHRQEMEAERARLDHLQATLEERAKGLHEQEQDYRQRLEQLRQEESELETQGKQLEEWHATLAPEADRLARQKAEQDEQATQLAQRAAALEGQQATLAALRTRLERTRDDLRREEQQLAEQRGRQETAEMELQQQLQEGLQLRAELEGERKVHEQDKQRLLERQVTLESQLQQLRQAQDQFTTERAEFRQQSEDLEQRKALQAEQEALAQARLVQLDEAHQRLETERQALRERTQAIIQAEQARETLQEQLRRRAEELAQKQKELADRLRQHQDEVDTLTRQREGIAQEHQIALDDLTAQRQHIRDQLADLDRRQDETRQREETMQRQAEKIKEVGQGVAQQRKALVEETETLQRQRREVQEARDQQSAEFTELRRQAAALIQQLPEVELHAGTVLERLTHAREQLRDHLGEVHGYARQCQDDLENVQARLQAEAEKLQQREADLRRHQHEHRLALSAFRQQLIDWQAQIAEMKRLLAEDESRLERRQAEVEAQARRVDATSQQLAQQAEELQVQKQVVADRRQEIDRHLGDMREWYRRKLRELSGVDEQEGKELLKKMEQLLPSPAPLPEEVGSTSTPTPPLSPVAEEGDGEPLLPHEKPREILSLTGDVDPADRHLGDLLQQLDLVDGDALTALLVEARRQRRSLRQVLLSGGVVTLYQLALIEAGNVDALMLGPVRVVDRLWATAAETAYRIIDPRHGEEELVLRHLAEAEMQDAVRPDEFRQRFRQAMLAHPNVAATREVLDIQGRPAVLQEWVTGLTSTDWPALAAAPGVCFRLLNQAALALHTIHQAGLVHGHLHEGLLVLTGEGILKICGLGEPPWLTLPPVEEFGDAPADLRTLGKIAASWCSPAGVRRGSKTKPLPQAFVDILYRLSTDSDQAYTNAADLLADLDRTSASIPANAEAWDRLIRHVQEHATPGAMIRQSA